MSKTKLVLIMYLFLILETFSCRSINEFYVYLVENVDEVKITFEFANFKENRTIKKSLIINQKDDIVNICKIIGDTKKPNLACGYNCYIHYYSLGKIVMSLKINLKADYIAFSKGIKSYRTNISKEGNVLLDNYRKEIINDLGPEWED